MERRRTRYPGIYEYTARGGRRRFQVVYRPGRGVDAPQRAASFDTLKEARDHQISRGHTVRETRRKATSRWPCALVRRDTGASWKPQVSFDVCMTPASTTRPSRITSASF